MSKTKKALYNTITTTLQMLVAQIVSLVVSRKVLEVYGSDLNGVNAILSNMMDWILLIEGGLTTASNVALFKPYVNGDYDSCNHILSATKKRFYKIGALVLVCGIGLAIIYPPLIKTDIRMFDIFLMFTMMSASTAFSVGFTRKYALLFNVSQHEYVNTIINTILTIAANVAVYFLAISNANYLFVRLTYLLGTVVTGIFVAIFVKRMYRFANYNVTPDYESIKGTTDVIFQKLTGLLRSSAPLVFISVFISATFASIYSVYIFIYGFIRKLVLMIVTASQSGIGQLIAQKTKEEVYKVFRVFEYASNLVVFWLMSIAVPMTMPFVRFYTKNVTNIEYVDYLLLFFIAGNIFIQVLHVPSGTVINMSGKFKEDLNFQILSIVVMLVGVFVCNMVWKTYGVLLGIMISSILLAVLEIYYTRVKIFKVSFKDLFWSLFINAAILLPLVCVEMIFLPEQFTIVTFVVFGIILSLLNGSALVTINYLLEKERFCLLIKRFKGVLKKG